MSTTNPIDAYLLKHGHPPTAKVLNAPSRQRVAIHLHASYIEISVYGGGFPSQRIYITALALRKLLKWLIPLVKHMDGAFHPPTAVRTQLRKEERLLKDQKAVKKRHQEKVRWPHA